MRAISLAAGLGPNYLSEVLTKGKEPGVEKVAKLCAELDISFSWLVTGAAVGPEAEEYLTILQELDAPGRDALQTLARALRKPSRP